MSVPPFIAALVVFPKVPGVLVSKVLLKVNIDPFSSVFASKGLNRSNIEFAINGAPVVWPPSNSIPNVALGDVVPIPTLPLELSWKNKALFPLMSKAV